MFSVWDQCFVGGIFYSSVYLINPLLGVCVFGDVFCVEVYSFFREFLGDILEFLGFFLLWFWFVNFVFGDICYIDVFFVSIMWFWIYKFKIIITHIIFIYNYIVRRRFGDLFKGQTSLGTLSWGASCNWCFLVEPQLFRIFFSKEFWVCWRGFFCDDFGSVLTFLVRSYFIIILSFGVLNFFRSSE